MRAPIDQSQIFMQGKMPNHEGNSVRKASKMCTWTGVSGERGRYQADWQEGGKQRSKKSFLDCLTCSTYRNKQIICVKRGQLMLEWKGFLKFRAEGEPLGMPAGEEWRAACERGETGLASYANVRLVFIMMASV